MPGSLALPKPQLRLSDPAESQRPLTFYAHILRRRVAMITLVSTALTALVVTRVCPAAAYQCGLRNHCDRPASGAGDDRRQSASVHRRRSVHGDAAKPAAGRHHPAPGGGALQPAGARTPISALLVLALLAGKESQIRNAPIVLKHLKVERNPNTYLFTITYRDKNPQVAADVANAIADSYLRDIFETRIKEAGRLTSSMERQLIDLKEKMESTHHALMVYQRDLGTADPEQKTSVLVARLQALNTENSVAEADRIAKEAVYREAKDGTLPEVEVSAQSSDLTKDVEKLQVAKANLALVGATYGDQHPEYRKAAALG